MVVTNDLALAINTPNCKNAGRAYQSTAFTAMVPVVLDVRLRVESINYHRALRSDWVRAMIVVLGRQLFSVLIVLVVACSCQWVRAQTPVPEGQRIIHESWTFKEGAPEAVEALAQTTDGYLWLGTPSGLFRFDGTRFELFRSLFGDQLPSTNISALFAPGTGGLWVAYRFGGFSFIKNGKVTDFLDLPVPTGSVQGFAQDRHGIVWAATYGGVWRFDGSSWQQNPAEWNPQLKAVAQVGFDKEGILWVLTDNRGIELKRQLFYLLPDGKQFRKAGDNLLVQGFTWDADHMVLTTHQKGQHEPGSGVELEISLPAYPILKKNSAQIVDRTDGVWFLPVDPVVLRHPAGEPLADFISKASRSNSQIYDINPYRYAFLVDREGSVWIGDQKGVHRFSYSPLIEQQFPNPESNPWFALAPDEGGVVWVSAGNQNGSSNLYRVKDGKAELQKSQGGVANFAYRAQDKTLWFGGEGGLWHVADRTLTRVDLPPAMVENAQYLQAISQDRLGGIWVSFGGRGLYQLANNIWTPYGGRHDLPTASVTSEFTDKLGRVWFGCRNRTLSVLDGDRVQTFGSSEGLRLGVITAIDGRGSEIWVGGEFGLQQFDHGQFHRINAVDKEFLRGISGIVETANGELWLNGLGGIVHLRRAEILEALKNPAYQVSGERFGRREGLPGLPPQLRPIPTAIEGTDGRLWFTVNNGVVWIDPARASINVAAPPVTIQSVSADDKGYPIDSPIKLPAHTSSVQISYAAVSLSDPEAIRFRYKLRETDQDWNEGGRSTVVSYRNLAPGSYHFSVTATDTNGVWSDKVATAEFTILPAFYQTWWFLAFCILTAVALLYLVYLLRLKQREKLRQLEAELAHLNRVSMLGELGASIAHEVNQPLAGVVSNASASLRWLAGEVPNVEEVREGLHRIVRDGKRAGEIIARIRALTKRAATPREKLDLNETIKEVLALVGDEAKRKSVIVRTRFAEDLSAVSGDRVQLQQVVLNLVMNGIEAMSSVGGRARELVIATRNVDADRVQVSIEDSGIGIDPEKLDKIFDSFYTTKPGGMGMGLSISRSILQAHGGRLWATRKDGPGTIFHFTLPKCQEGDSHAGV